ncbi:hypothetical protein C1Y40_00019 [Mycobacterium talmoniae]|uniref:Uncharacterized protein n=1 Tax=Mycobacterium talmoniae TaxID=1858794 RepID=A0A2S8BSX1_9MYCO|nr:hypothetical protein C1Y40_00019 [Mycobacterium talmoniae]
MSRSALATTSGMRNASSMVSSLTGSDNPSEHSR